MTRDQALVILGVDGGLDPGEIREAYASGSADLAQRIASAAAPSLRQKYEQQAVRLREARNVLLGDGSPTHAPTPLTLTQQLDLPRLRSFTTGPVDVSRPLTAGAAPGISPHDAAPRADAADQPNLGADPPPEGAAPSVTGRNWTFWRETRCDPPAEGAAPCITIGQVLAERYEVRAHLGSGGMGAVFAAFDRLRQEEIAVKVLLPHLLADPKARDRFLNEAKIASSLSHPNIVRVYDIHQTDRFTFLTMERLKGRNLREEIARRAEKAERFSITEIRGIAVCVCEALQHAHMYTLHRDVKPENIWIGEDGTVKLMDFGIARLLRPSQLTTGALAMGTAYYMAPEQLRGEELGPRADQFAVGVMLYELLTGEIPLGVVKPPHQLRRNLPAALSRAVMTALEARAEARHADMATLQRALAARGHMSWFSLKSAVAAGALLLAVSGIAAYAYIRHRGGQASLRDSFQGPGNTTARARDHEVGKPVDAGASNPPNAAGSFQARDGKPAGSSPKAFAALTAEQHMQAGERLLPGRGPYLRLAASHFTAAIKLDPRLSRAFAGRGRARNKGREFDKAIEDYNEAVRLDAGLDLKVDLAKAFAGRAAASHAKGDHERAIADCNRAIQNDPKCEWAFSIRASARINKREPEYDNAIADCTEAIRLNLHYAAAYHNRGTAWHRKGERDKAIADYTETIRLDPKDSVAYSNRGSAWRDSGQFDKAIADYRMATGLDPNRADDFKHLGRLLEGTREFGGAAASYTKAISLDPKNARLLVARGAAWSQQRRYDLAIPDYTRAIELDKLCAWAFVERGNALFHTKQYNNMNEDYAEAERLEPQKLSSYRKLRDWYKATGKRKSLYIRILPLNFQSLSEKDDNELAPYEDDGVLREWFEGAEVYYWGLHLWQMDEFQTLIKNNTVR